MSNPPAMARVRYSPSATAERPGLGSRRSSQPSMLALLPYGLAWAMVGLRMTFRGAPTVVDLPINPADQEVQAA